MNEQIGDIKNQMDQAALVGPKVQAALAEAVKAEQQAQNILADAVAARKKAEIALESANAVENRAMDAMAKCGLERKSWEAKLRAVTDSIAGLSLILENLKQLAGG